MINAQGGALLSRLIIQRNLQAQTICLKMLLEFQQMLDVWLTTVTWVRGNITKRFFQQMTYLKITRLLRDNIVSISSDLTILFGTQ